MIANTKNEIIWRSPRTICSYFNGIREFSTSVRHCGWYMYMVHFGTPETKEYSKQLFPNIESVPKKGEGCFFIWDGYDCPFFNYLDKGKPITGAHYALLWDLLKTRSQEKYLRLAHENSLFHHDNAPVHSSSAVVAKLMVLSCSISALLSRFISLGLSVLRYGKLIGGESFIHIKI